MRTNPIHGAGTGLPAAMLDEIHDCLTLALDATEGPRRVWQADEARSYMRAALRKVQVLGGVK